MTKKLNLSAFKDTFIHKLRVVRRYLVVLFLLIITAVYSYTYWRITALYNAQPSDSAIISQTSAIGASPHVDKTVVQQLQQLQDNSVSVKTLFEQTRNNPFQE